VRILIADDDPVNRHRLQAFLAKWDYEVVVACDGDEAWNILRQADAPKLAILDWMMPGIDGTQLCRELRKGNNESYTYILLLTAKSQKADIITGLDAGADDYLGKPFDTSELRARLRTGRRILELQEQLRSAYERLKFEATHDPLTGLASRAAVLEILRIELSRAGREGSTLGILLADLDHFKQVNDTYGHLAGDAVLRETAKRMRASLRPYDAVGRYGGEEFLIILPGSHAASSIKRAECLRTAVERVPVNTSEGKIPVTVSIGVTIGGGTQPDNIELLVKAADTALYQAKINGRNRVQSAEPNHQPFQGAVEASTTNRTMAEE
jgi:two-component system cell cycle response regulator